MSAAAVLCPGCRARDVPIVRIDGIPSLDARAMLDAGDAEIAGECLVDQRRGPIAPLRCRHCRRLFVDSSEPQEVLAELAVGGPVRQVAPRVWVACGGVALCVVFGCRSEGTRSFVVSELERACLLAARRPVVVLCLDGHAARFVAGRGLRAQLTQSASLELVDLDGLEVRVGATTRRAVLRPRVVRPRRRTG